MDQHCKVNVLCSRTEDYNYSYMGYYNIREQSKRFVMSQGLFVSVCADFSVSIYLHHQQVSVAGLVYLIIISLGLVLNLRSKPRATREQNYRTHYRSRRVATWVWRPLSIYASLLLLARYLFQIPSVSGDASVTHVNFKMALWWGFENYHDSFYRMWLCLLTSLLCLVESLTFVLIYCIFV